MSLANQPQSEMQGMRVWSEQGGLLKSEFGQHLAQAEQGLGFREVVLTSEVGLVSKKQVPSSVWCAVTSPIFSPWQGGRSEQCGDPGVQPRPVCPWRSAVPATEEQPHVERSAAGRTVVAPGCLLGRRHCGHREQVVCAQVRQPHPTTSVAQRKWARLNLTSEMAIPYLLVNPYLPDLPGLELSFQVHPQILLEDGPLFTIVVAQEPRAKIDSLHINTYYIQCLTP